MNKLIFVIILSLAMIFINLSAMVMSAGQADTDGQLIEQTAKRLGTTKSEDLNSAFSELFKLERGGFLDAKTELIDESISEKIAAHSLVQVKSYQEFESEDILGHFLTSVATKKVNIDRNITAVELINLEGNNSAEELIINYFDNNNINDLYQIANITSKIENSILYAFVEINVSINSFNQHKQALFILLDQISKSRSDLYYRSNSFVELNKIFWKNAPVNHRALSGKPFLSTDYCDSFCVDIPISPYVYTRYILPKKLFDEIINKGELKSLLNLTINVGALNHTDLIKDSIHQLRLYNQLYFEKFSDNRQKIVFTNLLVEELPVSNKILIKVPFEINVTDIQFITGFDSYLSITKVKNPLY